MPTPLYIYLYNYITMINKDNENITTVNETKVEDSNINKEQDVKNTKVDPAELDWEKVTEEPVVSFGEFKIKKTTFKWILALVILATSMLITATTNNITLFGLGMDMSLIVILIGRRYIGMNISALICLVFPWAAAGTTDLSILWPTFLILQALCILGIDWIFNRRSFTAFGITMVILLGTLVSVLIQLAIVGPLMYYIAETNSGNLLGSIMESVSFLKFEMTWMITVIIFNPIKLSLVYGITFGIWYALENSLNMEPNY